MREELGVSEEELIKQLRHCAASSLQGCDTCPQRIEPDCMTIMLLSAADEIERLTASPVAAATPSRSGRARELTANEYQRLALRTKPTYTTGNDQLINAALGLAGESGEFADLLKKYLFQGHSMDHERMVKELGDVLWYVSLAADALGLTLSEVMWININKLKQRYPEGFDAERSRNREEEA